MIKETSEPRHKQAAPRLRLEVAILTKYFSELGTNSNIFRSNFQRRLAKMHTGLYTWSWLSRQCSRSLPRKKVCNWGQDTDYICRHTLLPPTCKRSCWCACNPALSVYSAAVVSPPWPAVCLGRLSPAPAQHPWTWGAKLWLKTFQRKKLTVCKICSLGLLLSWVV